MTHKIFRPEHTPYDRSSQSEINPIVSTPADLRVEMAKISSLLHASDSWITSVTHKPSKLNLDTVTCVTYLDAKCKMTTKYLFIDR